MEVTHLFQDRTLQLELLDVFLGSFKLEKQLVVAAQRNLRLYNVRLAFGHQEQIAFQF